MAHRATTIMKQIQRLFIVKLLITSTILCAIACANERLQGLNPQPVKIPSFEQFLSDKCYRTAGSDNALEQISKSAKNVTVCVESKIDDEMKFKLENTTFNIDTWKTYCEIEFSVIECIREFANKLDVCLAKDEREFKDTLFAVIQGLLNFACRTNSDQIALLLEENGLQCIEKKQVDLKTCFDSTLRNYIDESTSQPSEGAYNLVMDKNKCDDMENLMDCSVQVLKTCDKSSPANLLESMFPIIVRETKCARFSSKYNAANEVRQAPFQTVLTTCLLALVATFIMY